MSDRLAPQTPSFSLFDLLLVGATVLVAMIDLYRKLRPRAGKPVCGNCPSECRCPLSEGRCEDPEEERR